ncbi:MAG: class I SAM-dependent methyltransferase [Clostridium sp.]|uniref:16S rRNA m(4)C1402 methyltranserfase n=1 Tax=Clostridium paraputrificum TaxID=29363 RepID=A0A6N3G3L5_9CLOT|nr:class I SAM-dependent methyltransferase [Clostridium sp.]MBS5927797.1 class I SAM-dependent methyltransferase [Clostridium sp.]MBS5985370.1 class I SAM-dependent methyltransferase [Clostridium sp.]
MFKYVGDISEISHHIINNFLENKNVAIDGTLGNGYDTDFLSENFNRVYSFDVQKIACDNYKGKNKENVNVINDSHHKFKEYIDEGVDCIMYNLGFLPGGDKSVTTMHETSLQSIKEGLQLLNNGGIMTICIYRGHNEGKKEESCILDYVVSLPKNKFGVMEHSFLNRSEVAPMLIVIEKK